MLEEQDKDQTQNSLYQTMVRLRFDDGTYEDVESLYFAVEVELSTYEALKSYKNLSQRRDIRGAYLIITEPSLKTIQREALV